MKRTSVLLSLALAGVMMVTAPEADAKRLGGGKSVGMQRQAPAKPADTSPPPSQQAGQAPAGAPTQAAPMAGAAAPAAAAAATAGKRNWLGPVAGIAAGLGIAALFSHMGWGEGLANFMTMALLAIVAVVAIRFLMRRFAGGGARPALQPAGAGAPFGGAMGRVDEPPMQRQALQPVPAAGVGAGAAVGAPATAAAPVAVPGGMDAADFERVAKQLFIRLQAVNDAGAVDDLRKFTTPELFAALRLDVLERGAAAQQTDVVQLDARVIDAETSADRWTVSVRFTGLIREQAEAGAERFDETWHFVRPADGSAEWAIAGIQNNG